MKNSKIALITGSAKRLGAAIARTLHERGMQVVIHYHTSKEQALSFTHQLNAKRCDSAISVQGDLTDPSTASTLIKKTIETFGQLDVLINNAAVFSPIKLHELSHQTWNHTLTNNLTAPFFLALQAAPFLQKTKGCIINMVDIRGIQPLKHYTPYCISKTGLIMATKSLALEWAPDIRVNGIAPGVVLWPDAVSADDEKIQQKIITRTPLKRAGTPEDIAETVYFLAEKAPYITGQVISVDGGRSLAY